MVHIFCFQPCQRLPLPAARKSSKEIKTAVFIGASLSEPHIDEFAVEFVYIYIYIVHRAVSHFQLLFLRHSLIKVTGTH